MPDEQPAVPLSRTPQMPSIHWSVYHFKPRILESVGFESSDIGCYDKVLAEDA